MLLVSFTHNRFEYQEMLIHDCYVQVTVCDAPASRVKFFTFLVKFNSPGSHSKYQKTSARVPKHGSARHCYFLSLGQNKQDLFITRTFQPFSTYVGSSVADPDPDPDPDPDWIRIQIVAWIRIRIRIRNTDPDPASEF